MTATTGSGPAWSGRRRLALDGLRAAAIVPVMAVHADRAHFPGGSVGVDVFFVLSAFLITSLILEEVDTRRGRFSFSGFYLRRALRLGPALLVWLVLLAAPTAALAGDAGLIVPSSLFSLFYVGNYAIVLDGPLANAYRHVWSLAVEEQFYLLWPPLLVWLSVHRRGVPTARLLMWGVGASAVVQLLLAGLVDDSYYLPTGHGVALSAGAAAAFWFRSGVAGSCRRVLCARGLPWAVLAALAVMTLAPDSRWLALTVVVASLGVAALVLNVCLDEHSAAARLLSLPPVVWVGQRSYGLYLYHRTLGLMVPFLVPGIRLTYAAPLVLALSLLLAELSFRLVERPVQRAGRAWLAARAST